MRWPAPEVRFAGSQAKRDVLKFAWFPVKVDTDDARPLMVWLEHYVAHQEWTADAYYGWAWRTIVCYSRTPFTNPPATPRKAPNA
jgi:hypothetical protein